ncbi:hypothetical protein [Streptomyces sp. CJ_13]|nr:hypothetical protein [Streptomyces sp. CJ_13]
MALRITITTLLLVAWLFTPVPCGTGCCATPGVSSYAPPGSGITD